MSHIPQIDLPQFFSVWQLKQIEFSWQDLTKSRKDGRGFNTLKHQKGWVSPVVPPQMYSAASAVSPKHISPKEVVNTELRKGAARGSWCVLSPHTHHCAITPAHHGGHFSLTLYCCHTHPKGKKTSFSPSLCVQPTHVCVAHGNSAI